MIVACPVLEYRANGVGEGSRLPRLSFKCVARLRELCTSLLHFAFWQEGAGIS